MNCWPIVPLKNETHTGSYKKKNDTNKVILHEGGTFSNLESSSDVRNMLRFRMI
jgi:hypothetical protein